MSELFPQFAREKASEDARAWQYVRVSVERGMDQGGSGEGLTYRSAERVEVGRRVEVPLGRGDKQAAGIVIRTGGPELAEGFDLSRVKAIVRDTGTGLTGGAGGTVRWMAGYYVCPLGMVLTAMLPAAVKERTGLRRVTVLERVEPAHVEEILAKEKLTPTVRGAWAAVREVEEDQWPLGHHALAAKTGQRTLAAINRLVKFGLLREVEAESVREFGGAPMQMSIEQEGRAVAGVRLTPDQERIVEGVSGGLGAGAFGVHLIRGVTGSGKTEVYLRVIERVLGMDGARTALMLVPEISLTPQIAGRFAERFRAAGVAVMHSGLSASQRHKEWARAASGAARVVVGARSAVFAPLERLGVVVVDEEHAGDYKQDQLPRYHGRDVAIVRARMAGCQVILGSATPSLESWANATGAEAKYRLWELNERVGGGALPRVEVVDLNKERREASARGRPARQGRLEQIGPTLAGAIEETLGGGGQVMLLLNKRGYASYIACADAGCGFVLSCEDCDAKMVQHRVVAGAHVPKGLVRCHHCLAQRLIPDACPECGKGLIALGTGTQRIEEELVERFGALLGADGQDAGSHAGAGSRDRERPHDRPGRDRLGSESAAAHLPREWMPAPGLMRIDGDTMKSARDWFDALSRFARGDIRLLLGTQMIAKGHDFPNVRLVGVVNADTALGLPDFRASERTFQLVSQVAGRAGRGTQPGRVIVQTVDPNVPAIRFAARHDFVGFAAMELEDRRRAGLPPATRMARIVCRDPDHGRALGAAEAIAGALRAAIGGKADAGTRGRGDAAKGRGVLLMGPMPCPIARIAGQYRFAIELTAPGRGVLQEVLQAVRAEGLLKSDSRTAVDIDPIALM